MGLRDIFLFTVVFSILPFIFKRPWVGVLAFSWLGYMNPHRYGWAATYYFPFSAIIGGITILCFLTSSENKKLPNNIVVILLSFFILWTTVTTYFAINEIQAYWEWKRFIKIQIMIFLTLFLFQSKDRLIALIWVIVFSIGFYAVKGGIFTIRTGGHYMVSGPPESFISGNTEIGFAIVVMLPLLFYLRTISNQLWIRNLILAAIVFSAFGVVGTHSRGAFLAGLVLCVFFWLKSKRKFVTFLALAALVPPVLIFMPDNYYSKMETIETYQEDNSALGRINAWWFAYNLSKDYPQGGGFQVFTRDLFVKYAPEPERWHDAHSIYFEVLAEQGYIGLTIFILLFVFSFLNCSYVIRQTRGDPDLQWANDLGRMTQASFVAYSVGGAFLGLAYFDLLYHLFAIPVLLRVCVDRELIRGANKDEFVGSLAEVKQAEWQK